MPLCWKWTVHGSIAVHGKWLVTKITVTSWAHIHCLVFINAQHVFMYVNESNFSMESNLGINLCLKHTWIPDCYSAAIYNKSTKVMGYWWEGSTSTASYTVGQYHKVEAITFRFIVKTFYLKLKTVFVFLFQWKW